MDSMNVFQQCWKNFEPRTKINPARWPESELTWINELNQAVFTRLEKILPPYVKVRSVTAPIFSYYTEAAGGYGVDTNTGLVSSYLVRLPDDVFEKRVEFATKRLESLIVQPCARTVFFYMPIYPDGNDVGTEFYKQQMFVRLFTTGETVDVKEDHG